MIDTLMLFLSLALFGAAMFFMHLRMNIFERIYSAMDRSVHHSLGSLHAHVIQHLEAITLNCRATKKLDGDIMEMKSKLADLHGDISSQDGALVALGDKFSVLNENGCAHDAAITELQEELAELREATAKQILALQNEGVAREVVALIKEQGRMRDLVFSHSSTIAQLEAAMKRKKK